MLHLKAFVDIYIHTHTHDCISALTFEMQGRILPWEPFVGTQEKRAIHVKRKQRVGFTTR